MESFLPNISIGAHGQTLPCRTWKYKALFLKFRVLMPSFVEGIFIEYLLCARHCARSWGHNSDRGRHSHCLLGILVLFILFYLFFQFFNYFIVVQLQLSAFSPHLSTRPQPNPPPSPVSTLPLGFVHVSSTVVPENSSPCSPLPTPLWLLLDCS